MRPLGAILFGEMGDRMVGRKNALVFSILLITVPSILMGLLPTYYTWGWISPVLLVILRMLQGLSVGGQLAGSYVLSIEQSSSSTRGFRGSICDASSIGGFLLASAVTTVTRSIFTEEQVNEWAWRLPFLFSLVLAPLLYHIVSHTEESKLWSERTEQKETEKIVRETEKKEKMAVVELMSSPFRRRQLLGMIGVCATTSSSFYTLFLWTPVYLSNLRKLLSEQKADFMNFGVVCIQVIFILIAGKLSDSFPHRMDLMRIGLPGVIVACPVMFAMFESESVFGIFLAQIAFGFCLSFIQGSLPAWEVELWMADPSLSFTGVAIGHNVAATLFGGTMPLMATFLFYRADSLVADDEYALFPRIIPGLYISLLGCVSLYCLSSVVRHPHDVRTGDSQLRNMLHREKKKLKDALKEKERRKDARKNDSDGLFKDDEYVPPNLA